MKEKKRPAHALAGPTAGRTPASGTNRRARFRGMLAGVISLVVFAAMGVVLLRYYFASPAAAVISPTTPTRLTASNITPRSVALTWAPSTDQVGVRDYLVLRGGAVIGSTRITVFVDSTVAPSTTYAYQVKAQDKARRASEPTAAISVTTQAEADSPAVPTGLSARAVGPTRVNLAWNPVTGPVAVVGYSIYRDGSKIGTSRAASFIDAGTSPATTYSYTVSARDSAGKVSRPGKVASVTTPAAASQPTRSVVPGGFPGISNTGYENAPGYPGSLKDCGNIAIRSNTTYEYCDFSGGLAIGSQNTRLINIKFIGCRFASNAVNDADVADYGDGIVFSYDTFEPNTVPASSEPASSHAAPVANSQGYQYGIDQRYAGSLTVDNSDFWGFEEAMQLGYSSQAKPVIISNSWIHSPRDPGGADHTDGILESYGGLSYMVFNHNTIVGDGNTNALALQGSAGYSHVTITNNYFSGYGYMVNSGADTNSTDMIFTGNIWGTDFEPVFGPLYGNNMYVTAGLGGVWANNTIYVQPGTTWMAEGNRGLFWWPDDTNPTNAHQIVGHRSDYHGP